jgi:hypothetical protein
VTISIAVREVRALLERQRRRAALRVAERQRRALISARDREPLPDSLAAIGMSRGSTNGGGVRRSAALETTLTLDAN